MIHSIETINTEDSMDAMLSAMRTRRSWLILGSSVVVAGGVCYAQILGNGLFLLVTLILFLAVSVYASAVGFSLPVLLFFLPWSPLMKLQQGGISFFTIAMLLCSTVVLVKSEFSIRKYQIFLSAAILLFSLTAKLLHDNTITYSFLFFFVMLVLFPGLSEEQREYDFWILTLFFALGIITAALSAQRVAGFGNISKYIKVDSYLTITRLSGYFGDPNFYSAHITACLGGVQMLLVSERGKARRVVMIIIELVLIYCGLLSASKTFVIVFAALLLIWIPLVLRKNNRGIGRFRLLIAIGGAVLVILLSPRFQSLIRILNDRFSYNANISQITTGRTDLWLRYFYAFRDDPLLFLLGEGYSNVNIGGKASHNTIIQGIFQFGLLGFPLLVTWAILTVKTVHEQVKEKGVPWEYILLMFTGVVLPWMSLDILFFDEFFLLPVYGMIGAISIQSVVSDQNP